MNRELFTPTNSPELKNGSREAEIWVDADGYEVRPIIGSRVSYAFPFKTFKTATGAIRYANKFLLGG